MRQVIRIVEWHQPFLPASDMFPGALARAWEENAGWLAPYRGDPDTGRTVIALQSWVLRTPDLPVRPGREVTSLDQTGLAVVLAVDAGRGSRTARRPGVDQAGNDHLGRRVRG